MLHIWIVEASCHATGALVRLHNRTSRTPKCLQSRLGAILADAMGRITSGSMRMKTPQCRFVTDCNKQARSGLHGAAPPPRCMFALLPAVAEIQPHCGVQTVWAQDASINDHANHELVHEGNVPQRSEKRGRSDQQVQPHPAAAAPGVLPPPFQQRHLPLHRSCGAMQTRAGAGRAAWMAAARLGSRSCGSLLARPSTNSGVASCVHAPCAYIAAVLLVYARPSCLTVMAEAHAMGGQSSAAPMPPRSRRRKALFSQMHSHVH